MSADRFGREIIDNGNNSYSVDGVIVEAQSFDAAISIFNAMAPDWWIEPIIPIPLDPIGALATLLAVNGTLTAEDAANAVGLNADDLIAEAQAWSLFGGGINAN